jgi:hypothetical protein
MEGSKGPRACWLVVQEHRDEESNISQKCVLGRLQTKGKVTLLTEPSNDLHNLPDLKFRLRRQVIERHYFCAPVLTMVPVSPGGEIAHLSRVPGS